MKVDAIMETEDIIKLEEYLRVTNYRDYIIFKIGVNLGLRVSDFLEMPPDLREEMRKAGKKDYYTVGYFREMCNRGYVYLTQQKTEKDVRFEIPENLKKLLLEYMEGKSDDAPMFPSRFGGKALTRVGFFLNLKEAAKAVGITKNIGCHSMRKTFGYFYYKKYKDIRQLMAIFNHSDPEVTLRYIGINQEEIDENMKAFSVGEFKGKDDVANLDEILALKRKMIEERKKQEKEKEHKDIRNRKS